MSKMGFVAIVGRPNSGKSTLLNQILKTRISIVTPKAQTTRERVLGILTEKDAQIVFIDTPGIHRAKEGGINEFMVQEAREALEAPSCVWYIVDPRTGPSHEQTVIDLVAKSGAPVYVVMNKMDIVGRTVPADVEERLERDLEARLKSSQVDFRGFRHISAQSGKGVGALLDEAWQLLPEGPHHYPDPEQLSDRPTRFFVAEKIREQLYLCLGDELPYSCGVEIDSFDEKSKPIRIEATIYVERESQKGMVIGKAGQKIKEIGMAARFQIEKFIGTSVYLGLKVKVLKEWTRDPEAMKRFGYRIAPGDKKRRAQ